MDAVATGAPADRYDQVAMRRVLARPISRDDRHIPAEDERVAEVAFGSPRLADLLRRAKDCLAQEVVESFAAPHLAPFTQLGVVDPGAQGFVRAVFGPGLSQRLQLGIGGVAAQFTVVLLDGLHLG